MKKLFSIICVLFASVMLSAGELEVSLKVNQENGQCVLEIQNVSSEPVTILKAFDRKSGMSADFPMGSSMRFQGTDEWIPCYSISSQLDDHGPTFEYAGALSEESFLKGPKQPEMVLKPNETFTQTFSIQTPLSWMWRYVEKDSDGMIRLDKAFYFKSGVYLKRSNIDYEYFSATSDLIENLPPLEFQR